MRGDFQRSGHISRAVAVLKEVVAGELRAVESKQQEAFHWHDGV